MNSASNKTLNSYLSTSRSRKTSTALSSASEESVFEKSGRRKYSFAIAETISRLNLKRGSVADNRNNRKYSVAFPVTEYASKWRKSSISDGENINKQKLLKHSKSDEALPRLNRQDSRWRVLQLVHSAQRKLSEGDAFTRSKRQSLFDVFKFVNFGKAEIQKRRMVRVWKQKARQKVIFDFDYRHDMRNPAFGGLLTYLISRAIYFRDSRESEIVAKINRLRHLVSPLYI